jgi:hypothetical protein
VKMPCNQCGHAAAALGPALVFDAERVASVDSEKGDRLLCGACIGQALEDLGSEKAEKWLRRTA